MMKAKRPSKAITYLPISNFIWPAPKLPSFWRKKVSDSRNSYISPDIGEVVGFTHVSRTLHTIWVPTLTIDVKISGNPETRFHHNTQTLGVMVERTLSCSKNATHKMFCKHKKHLIFPQKINIWNLSRTKCKALPNVTFKKLAQIRQWPQVTMVW